jgi:hypothetical protein
VYLYVQLLEEQETEQSNLDGKSKNNNKKGLSQFCARGIAFFVLGFGKSVCCLSIQVLELAHVR